MGDARIPVADEDTRFAERIRERLTTAGFSVVPAETVLAGWQASVASVGGIFDRRSGRRDTLRCRMADERMSEWLRDSLGCGLWLRYELVEVLAEYDHGETRWDGVSAQVGAPGLLPTLIQGFSEGKVPALSIEVSMWNWYRFPTGYLLSETLIETAGGTIAGIAIAAIVRPKL